MMSGIRGRNTKPELQIRSALHRLGFRFRLNVKGVPGRPDLVLPKYRAAILVHGCFWHGHDCSYFHWPKTRQQFWRAKIIGNRRRDRRVSRELEADGWRQFTVWECALRDTDEKNVARLALRLARWLKGGSRRHGEMRRTRTR